MYYIIRDHLQAMTPEPPDPHRLYTGDRRALFAGVIPGGGSTLFSTPIPTQDDHTEVGEQIYGPYSTNNAARSSLNKIN